MLFTAAWIVLFLGVRSYTGVSAWTHWVRGAVVVSVWLYGPSSWTIAMIDLTARPAVVIPLGFVLAFIAVTVVQRVVPSGWKATAAHARVSTIAAGGACANR